MSLVSMSSLLAGSFGISQLHSIVNDVQGQICRARWKMTCKLELYYFMYFGHFGPHFVDCGHSFVYFVKK